jgi:hypothetical protein
MRWVACAVYMKGNENCIRNSGQKTLETNQGVGKGTKLKCILEQCFSNIFYVPLSQHKTCSWSTVTVQNMYVYHRVLKILMATFRTWFCQGVSVVS